MNATQNTREIDPARKLVVFGILSGLLFAGYCLYLSREHITFVGYFIGLRALEAETLFIFIDFLALYGKMLTSKKLSAKTRRIGYKFMIGGGAASLICNVLAGLVHGEYGQAGYGAAIVGLIVSLEYAIANTKAKATTKRKPRTATAAPAAGAIRPVRIVGTGRAKCAPGCTCRKHTANRVSVAP